MILDTDNIYGTILSKMDYARKTSLPLSLNHSYLGNDFDMVLIRPFMHSTHIAASTQSRLILR